VEPLFSYGTLQLETVQLATFGRRLEGHDDILTGYAVIDIAIRDPDVLEASGIAVHKALVPSSAAPPLPGKVFQLTSDELAAADIYESENYRRVSATLASGAPAWIYVKA
jgi:hypothetical protein